MSYASAITQHSTRARLLLKIAGVPRYFATWDGGTYDDSAGGNTHGSQSVDGDIVDASVTPGRLSLSRRRITPTTATITLGNSDFIETMFSRRKAGQYLESGIASTAVQADVGDNSGFAAGDIVHVGPEAVELSGVTSTNLIDFSPSSLRGVLGTSAIAHPAGVEVALTPRHWIGRRAWIVMGCKTSAGTWEYQDPYRAMKIMRSPLFENGAWQLSLSDDIGDVEFYRGFKEAKATKTNTTILGGHICLYLDNIAAVVDSAYPSTQAVGLMLAVGGSVGVFKVASVVTASGYVQINTRAQNLASPDAQTFREWLRDVVGVDPTRYNSTLPVEVTARAVYPMMSGHGGDSNPADIALRVMLSDLGDKAVDADLDVLPGVAAQEYAEQIRAGCGLQSADVDKASWLAAGEGLLPSRGFILGGAGTEKLGDFLSTDICPMLGGYWYRSRTGGIAFKKYEAATPATSADFTVNDDVNIGNDASLDDETAIVASVVVDSKYNWGDKSFEHRSVINMQATLHIYRETARTIEIRSRLAGSTEADLLNLFDQHLGRFGEGGHTFQVKTTWGAHLIDPGDTVLFTNSRIPAGDDTSGGIASMFCEVISVDPDFETGEVELELVRRPTAKLISQTILLGPNISGGEWNALLLGSDETLDAEIAVGWLLQFYDQLTGAIRAGGGSSVATVNAVTSSTITLTGGPTDLAVSDVGIFADYGTANSTATNTATGADQEDHAFISSTGRNPSGAGDRWG